MTKRGFGFFPSLRLAALTASLGCIVAPSIAGAVNFYFVSDYATPQAAINAAGGAGGGVVRFPCGTTTISSGLTVTQPGVTLEGCGQGGSTIAASFATGDIISLGAAAPFVPCGGVRDLSIASSVTRTSGYAIAIAGCENVYLENLRVQTSGGGGVHVSTSGGSHAAIVYMRALDIEISGAFTALRIDGSLEQHITNSWLRGNWTAGSRGIVITDTGGVWARDVEAVQFEVGVSIEPPAGKDVGWSHFDNVLADTNTSHGFQFIGAGTIRGFSCVRCWSATNGYSTATGNVTNINARGFYIANGNGMSFAESRVINNGGHGVEVTATPKDLEFNGGIVAGNCVSTACSAGTGVGMVFTGTNGFRVLGMRAGQSVGGPNTQGYGIFVNTGCNNYIVANNDTRLNVTGGIANIPGTSATRIVVNNLQ